MSDEIAVGQRQDLIERVSDMFDIWDKYETWRSSTDHPAYEVSSWGRVRRGARILKPGLSHGYEVVTLSHGRNVKTARVHRLVALAFLGDPPFANALVAHNDGGRTNNRVSNLRWASALENQADRIRHNSRRVGSEVFGSKLTEEDIPEIRRRVAAGERYPSVANDFGVSVSTIHLIKKGRTWAHV
ncbi:HNH endonuclease [Aquamicrobium lusatiense]|uniref:HNH endonuclease n=1 Tax=Aquamicrobium lusatiense TaxID=89772 RepID=UPI002453E77D|nr:HNH endonuclease [Aquamicrobium lusatiense]MDH4993029.1 HNH endonuclease [Aquamicrobium lusatiense]